ncbi:hypothetical protein KXR83_16570 [Williamsia muralis]|uniref:hypothetical protein n=1 Tax=Williamsia marianensis TaxID=85044 RepID=UPI003F17FA20
MLKGERVPPWQWCTGPEATKASPHDISPSPLAASTAWPDAPAPQARTQGRRFHHHGQAAGTRGPHRPAGCDATAEVGRATVCDLLVLAAAMFAIVAFPLWLLAGSIGAGLGQIGAIAAATCTTLSPVGLVALAWWIREGANNNG